MGTERGSVAQRDVDLDTWFENLNDGLSLGGKAPEAVDYIAVEKVRGRPPRAMRLYSVEGGPVSLLPPFGADAWQALIAEFGDGMYYLRPRAAGRFVGTRHETVSGLGPGTRKLEDEPAANPDGAPAATNGGPLAFDDPRRELLSKRAEVQGKKLDRELLVAERDLERERQNPAQATTATATDTVITKLVDKTIDRALAEPQRDPVVDTLLKAALAPKDGDVMKVLAPILTQLVPAITAALTRGQERDPLMTQFITNQMNQPAAFASALEVVSKLVETRDASAPAGGMRESIADLLEIAEVLGLRRGGRDDTPGWVHAVERLGPSLAQPLTEWARAAQMMIASRAGVQVQAYGTSAPAIAPTPVSTGLPAIQARVAFASSVNDEGEFPRIAETIARDVPQGGEFLRLVKAGTLPGGQAIVQLHNAGLVPTGADNYVLRFLQWVRTAWSSATPMPPAPAAPPAATPASALVVAKCEKCGTEFEWDTEAEFAASNQLCDVPACAGALQRVA